MSAYNETIFPTLRNNGAGKSLETMIEAFKLFKEATEAFLKEVAIVVKDSSSNELKLGCFNREHRFLILS